MLVIDLNFELKYNNIENSGFNELIITYNLKILNDCDGKR
jgi:hypothetical protein